MGGVYNPFNLGLYTFTHQNPVKYVDPDGRVTGVLGTFVVLAGATAIIVATQSPKEREKATRALGQAWTNFKENTKQDIKNLKDWFLNESSEPEGDKGTDKPSLLDPQGEKHVLDGDEEGGGHAPGTGNPGKSEFPADWSRDKILGEISDVATDPNSSRKPGRDGRTVVEGTRDRVDIRVIVDPKGRIESGWPKKGPGVVQNPE